MWASSWDSDTAASRFASTWVKERQKLHKASVTRTSHGHFEWVQPDGRKGALTQRDNQIVIFETDRPDGLADKDPLSKAITFTQPPEDAARASANHAISRFNPLVSWQKDDNYIVTKALWGILSRHDRNSVGAADRLVLGLLADWHRTKSFTKWELGWSLVAKHQSDSRRGVYKTTVLPWGILCGQFSARLPQDPSRKVSRVSVLWGLLASRTHNSADQTTFNLLPAGLLLRDQLSPSHTSFHILGTGARRTHPTATRGATTRYRLFGSLSGRRTPPSLSDILKAL